MSSPAPSAPSAAAAAPAPRIPVSWSYLTPPDSGLRSRNLSLVGPKSDDDFNDIDFYFDLLSPYAYFAFELLSRYQDEWLLCVHLKPIFQSAVMKSTNNTPPAAVPAKAKYMQKDLQRLSRYFDVPIQMPTRLQEVMFGSLPLQRLLCAVQLERPEILGAVVRNFWRRHWSRNEDVLQRESQVAALREGMEDKVSLAEAEALIEHASGKAAKALLAQHTDDAIKDGVFGVPSMVVRDRTTNKRQLIFGSDRMHILATMIGEEWRGPKPTKSLARRLLSKL